MCFNLDWYEPVPTTGNFHDQAVLTLSCPAKVNLVLSVGASDKGLLHPLVSWMVTVTFSDTLSLDHVKDDGVAQFDIRPAADDEQDRARAAGETIVPRVCVDWPLQSDLVFLAHALLQEHVGAPLAVNLNLRKRIPTGAGLGGGSSNAAATLVAMNRWFELGLDRQTLIGLGQRLGSDVGFLVGAILGQTSALVTGVGDQIEPMPLAQPIHLVLIFPPLACPTAAVYGAFDRRLNNHPPSLIDPNRLRKLANNLPLAPEAPWNDLDEAAFAVAPELRTIVNRLQQQLDRPIHVTGSGSTLYLIAPSDAAAIECARTVTQLSGLPAVATQTLSCNS